MNEETHRLRFRQDRRKGEESHREWADRLCDHFEKWTKESGDVPLKQVMLLEQFIMSVPEELAVWIEEKKPASLRQAAELADMYTLARKGDEKQAARKPRTGSQAAEKPTTATPTGPERRFQSAPRKEIRCYHCNGVGHIMSQCPQRRGPAANPRGLLGKSCEEVAWNMDSHKYLRRGTLDGRTVQMLIDTGCDRTMVASDVVDQSKVDDKNKVPVLRVHGDTVLYPTAAVEI